MEIERLVSFVLTNNEKISLINRKRIETQTNSEICKLVAHGEERGMVKINKSVLVASSYLMHRILQDHSKYEEETVIVLENTKYSDLLHLENFLYTGELCITKSEFKSFFELGERLEVKLLSNLKIEETGGLSLEASLEHCLSNANAGNLKLPSVNNGSSELNSINTGMYQLTQGDGLPVTGDTELLQEVNNSHCPELQEQSDMDIEEVDIKPLNLSSQQFSGEQEFANSNDESDQDNENVFLKDGYSFPLEVLITGDTESLQGVNSDCFELREQSDMDIEEVDIKPPNLSVLQSQQFSSEQEFVNSNDESDQDNENAYPRDNSIIENELKFPSTKM